MPFVGEHACRIREPKEFVRFRRNNETDPNTIIGFRKDDSSDIQSFRYPTKRWTEARARKHCAEKKGRFEAAIKPKDKNAVAAACDDCDDAFEASVSQNARSRKCAEILIGLWCVEPMAFSSMFEAVQEYGIPVILQTKHDDDEDKEKKNVKLFDVVGNVAVFHIEGFIVKHHTSFQDVFTETSTVEVRRGIRKALADPGIESMVLLIDSPGGTTEGTHALLEELAKARALMPVIAQIDDLGASAAWFIAAQAHRIVVNKTAIVGSLGTFAHVVDSSGKAAMDGMRHHIIKAGEHKGDFEAGMPITDSQLAEAQRMVNDLNEQFLITSAQGRGVAVEKIRELADGGVHIGAKAVDVGLADTVGDLESAIKLAKETAMNDQEKAAAFEAENPEIVQSWRKDAATQAVEESGSVSYDKGLDEGKKIASKGARSEEHTRLQEIVAAVGPGREALAIKEFLAGKTPIEAKASLADTLGKENANLTKQLESASDGEKPVSFIAGDAEPGEGGGEKPKDPETIEDPKERAEAEWDQGGEELQASWSSRERYVMARTAELDGRLKVSNTSRRRG